MKNKAFQRAFSLVLTVMMLLTMLPAAAFAQSESTQTETGSIIIESYNPVPGETITVNVSLKNNPGIAAMRIQMVYDNSVFSLIGLEYNSKMGGETNPPEDLSNSQSPFVLYWNNGGMITDYTEDGVFATLTFKVSENAAKGRSYTISAVYDPDEIYNGQDDNVSFEIINGKYVVYDCVAGDIDGNGKVNMRDLTVLQRNYSGWTGLELNTPVMDANGDGKTNIRDVTTLQRYLAGWDVELCCPCTVEACTHNLTAMNAKPATCTEDGNIAYWICGACGKYFSDAEAETEIAYADTLISAAGHSSLMEIPAKTPTCTESGSINYWYCLACGKYYSDAETTTEIHYDDTVISAVGHTDVTEFAAKDPTYTENGNIPYWYCNVCQKYFSDANCENMIAYNDTVIPAKTRYAIQYYLYDNSEYLQEIGVENSNPAYYDPEEGLKLKNLNIDGYTFEGWYDGAGSNATQVKEIAKGESGEIDLYARWTPVEYKITYVNAAVHSNPTTYTVEERVVLSDPEWSGLAFANWTDNSGKVQTTVNNGKYQACIEKGTTGSIELIANWESRANYAVPETGIRELAEEYDPETGLHYFVYKLGTIHNVVLDTLAIESKAYGEEIKWQISETVSLEDSVAKTAAETVSNSVSKTSEWANTKEWTESHSETLSWNAELGVSGEWQIKKIFKLGFELSGGIGKDYTDEYSNSSSNMVGGSSSGSTEETIESSSTVAYNQAVEKSFSTEITIGADMPAGEYSYVYYTDVEVFAAVLYDPVSGNYKVDTFSVMDDELKAMRLYTPAPESNVNIKTSAGLPCDIPLDELEAFMNNAYYVKYDANGGTGTMLNSGHIRDVEHELSDNSFTKVGYLWNGWKLADGTLILKDQQVSNLAEKGDLLTATAQWTPITYTVVYHGNEATSGSMSNSTFAYDTNGNLRSNGFSRTGYTFAGWATSASGSTVYSDKASVKNMTAQQGLTIDLYAKWTANSYTVTYNANGGTGTTQKSTHTYDTSSSLNANGYTRSGYTFCGWSTSSSATTPTYTDKQTVKNLTTSGNITLYAVWVKTEAHVDFNTGNKTRDVTLVEGDTHTDTVVTGMSKAALIANGYKNVEIKVVFDAKRKALFSYNNAKLELIANNTCLGDRTWDIGDHFGQDWTDNIEKSFTISVTNLNADGSFTLKWYNKDDGTLSTGETWYLGETNVTVTAKK